MTPGNLPLSQSSGQQTIRQKTADAMDAARGSSFAADQDEGPQRGSGRPIPPLVSEIQVATTNVGTSAQGGLTPNFLALSSQVIVCGKLKGFGFRVEGANPLAHPSDQNGFVPGAKWAETEVLANLGALVALGALDARPHCRPHLHVDREIARRTGTLSTARRSGDELPPSCYRAVRVRLD